MKKLLICLLLLCLTGCTKENQKTIIYNNLINDLEKVETSSAITNFKIDIMLTKFLEDEISYKVVIDEAVATLTNVQVLIIHDQKTNDIYPSIGLFDEEVTITTSGKGKGLILGGYINTKVSIDDFHGTFKVYLSYEIDGEKQINYFIKQY